jgi:hypothetical protein
MANRNDTIDDALVAEEQARLEDREEQEARESERERKTRLAEEAIERDARIKALSADTPVSRAVHIGQVSAAMGFSPRQVGSTFVTEYVKDYGFPGGHRAARVTAQFDRGVAGMDHAQLRGFVVTVTAYLPARPEIVKKQAPEVMRNDLVAFMERLGGPGAKEQAALMKIICEGGCGAETAEFFTFRKKRLCADCFKRKTGGAPES